MCETVFQQLEFVSSNRLLKKSGGKNGVPAVTV